jgi:hypothetical protein
MFTIVDRGADLLVRDERIGSELAVALKADERLIVFASAVARMRLSYTEGLKQGLAMLFASSKSPAFTRG